jgi:hypothetical protein
VDELFGCISVVQSLDTQTAYRFVH